MAASAPKEEEFPGSFSGKLNVTWVLLCSQEIETIIFETQNVNSRFTCSYKWFEKYVLT